MHTMKEIKRFILRKDLIEKNTREGLFLLTSDGRYLFSLNEVGAFIWNAFKQSKTRTEILKDLVYFYDVEEELAKKDLDIFIKEVKRRSSELIANHI